MNRYFSFAIVFTALAVPSVALAQGSGSTAPKKKDSFGVTRNITGKVVIVEAGESIVIEAAGARQEFKLAGEAKTPSDLKKGDQVKITYRASDNKATEVRRANSTP